MTKSIKLLQQNRQALQDQLYWLQRSCQLSKDIDLQNNIVPEQMDILETLSARFARTVEFLVPMLQHGNPYQVCVPIEDCGNKIKIKNMRFKQ